MLISTRFCARVALLAGLVGLLLPSVSGAAAFSIDAPVAINDAGSGVIGTLSPVPFFPPGPITTFGTFSGDILLVEFSLAAGSADVDQLGISGVGVSAIGGIFYPNTGTQAPNQTAGQATEFQGSSLIFNFEHLATAAGNLQAGESTGVLGVVFNVGDLPPPGLLGGAILADTAQFMISSGADFSVNALVVPVPEPGTALLLGLGLAGLASSLRKR